MNFKEFVEDFQKYCLDLVMDMEAIGVTFFEEVKTEKENKVRVFFQDNEWYISINDYALFQVFDKYEDFLQKLHELVNEYKLAIV